MECIKKIVAIVAIAMISAPSIGQITSGRIVFERKTNLKKKMGDNPRMKEFINDKNKIRIEMFELIFNDTSSAFLPIERDEPEEGGCMRYMTTKNKVYQNLEKREKFIIMDLWGSEAFLRDTMPKRQWKITDSKRRIGEYMCTKAIWEKNDSTRIYAWFSVDIVPTVGPEGFDGLPGAILGLATEDGGLIYFAKEVKAMEPPAAKLTYDVGKKDVYSKEELKAILTEKMGQWVKPKDMDEMFSWL